MKKIRWRLIWAWIQWILVRAFMTIMGLGLTIYGVSSAVDIWQKNQWVALLGCLFLMIPVGTAFSLFLIGVTPLLVPYRELPRAFDPQRNNHQTA